MGFVDDLSSREHYVANLCKGSEVEQDKKLKQGIEITSRCFQMIFNIDQLQNQIKEHHQKLETIVSDD
jgi:hypothetical protein